MSKLVSKYAVFFIVIFSLVMTNSHADEPKVFGFISQSYINSDDNPFFSDTAGGHFDLREIAITGSWKIDNKLRLAGQILSRKAGDIDDGEPKIDFLLLDYSFYLDNNITAGVRVGRIKNQYGIYNSTRDVPHARPGVFVPQSIYFENYRDVLHSTDGINFYLSDNNNLGDVNLDVYFGSRHLSNDALEYQLYQDNIPGDFEKVDISGLKLALNPKFNRNLNFAVSVLDIDIKLENNPVFAGLDLFNAATALGGDPTLFPNYITSLQIESFATLLSAQYTLNQWLFTAEYMQLESDLTNFSILHQSTASVNATTKGYYLQVEWNASEKLNVFSRYEELYYNDDDKDGAQLALATGGNANTQFGKSFTVGARWYFNTDLSVTGQLSQNEGTAWLVGSENIDYDNLVEDWLSFVLQVSYHF